MFRSDALTLETAAWFGSSVNDLTFWTFSVSPSVFPVGPVVGGVGGVLLLLAVFGFFIWRRNNNGEITGNLCTLYYMYLHDIFGDIFSELFDNLALLNSVMLIIVFFIILPVFQGSSLQTVSNINKMPQLVFTLLVTDTLFTVTGDISFSVLCLS